MTCKPCIAGNHGECEIQDDDTGDVCSCEACDLPDVEDEEDDEEEEDTDYNDEE